jgi:hypothetical protein
MDKVTVMDLCTSIAGSSNSSLTYESGEMWVWHVVSSAAGASMEHADDAPARYWHAEFSKPYLEMSTMCCVEPGSAGRTICTNW